MGICASCLGKRRHDSFDEDDDSRLLLDDPNSFQYGSFGDQSLNPQADPLETQREAEALQNVVTRTSNNLVDIFEITPQEPQRAHPTVFSGQDARLARYQNILSKLSSDDDVQPGAVVQGHMDWLSDDEGMESHGETPGIKEVPGDSFVGTFADAAAAAA